MTNSLKDKLKRGEVTIGTWCSITHPDVTEILSAVSYDWIMFDMEHGPLTIASVQQLMQPMNGSGTQAIVRVARNNELLIGQALDAGAAGVVVPLVHSRAEAEQAVAAAMYPPRGSRGIGPRRATGYGRNFDDYLATANDRVVVIVMIESAAAVTDAEGIASVPGLDAVIIGPGDLSASLGCFHDRSRADFVAALDRIVEVCNKHRVAPGMAYVGSAEKAKAYIDQGFRFIGLGEDVDHLTRGATGILTQLRQQL